MPWCVVIGCRNNLKATRSAGKDVSYHSIPKNPERRNAWINTLNHPLKFKTGSPFICSEHFIPEDFEYNSLKEQLLNIKVKKQLKKTAIPSINIPKSLEKKSPVIAFNILNSPNVINTNLKNMNEFDMHHHCAVPVCQNQKSVSLNGNNNVLLHKFPDDVKTLEKWLIFCNGPDNTSIILTDYLNARICSKHFHKDDYEHILGTKSRASSKVLKKNAVPSIYNEMGIIESSKDESIKLKRKELVDKLLADYDKQKNNEGFFTPNIYPNAKIGDKLKLLKALDNPESPPKIKNMTPKTALGNVEEPSNKHTFSNDSIIQITPVQGGIMLHALPKTGDGGNPLNSCSENKSSDDENELIIVTEDETAYINLTADSEQHKEKNSEVIIMSDSKETKKMDTVTHIDSESKKCFIKIPVKRKNESYLKDTVNNYIYFFSPNSKFDDKLNLLKTVDNPESYSQKKKKMTPKTALGNVEVPSNKHTFSNDSIIQITPVQGGIMLHALPKTGDGGNPLNSCSENKSSDDENELIIVTEDETAYINLTADSEQHKEKNSEVIIVSDSKETKKMDTVTHIDSESKKCFIKIPAKRKNESYLKDTVNNYTYFFSPNSKLDDKLNLLKTVDNPESYSQKKKKMTPKTALGNVEVPSNKHTYFNKDPLIQLTPVQGGIMLHALPKIGDGGNPLNSCSENNVTDDENEFIIVTKEEANYANLTTDSEQHKEKNSEVIIVSDSKETKKMDTVTHIDSESKKCFIKIPAKRKNESYLNDTVNKYTYFFSPKIDPNSKLGNKLNLLKTIDNPISYSQQKKMIPKTALGNVEVPLNKHTFSKDSLIKIAPVEGRLMVHALPKTGGNLSNSCNENNSSDDDNKLIIVTEDEATVNLTADSEQHKEKNGEVIVESKKTKDMNIVMRTDSKSTKCITKTLAKPVDNIKCRVKEQLINKIISSAVYSPQVTLSEDKGCQVLIPCKGCEQRSLKINKLLRERTILLSDLNQNGAGKDLDEINTLKKFTGVLSLLLLQCIGDKYGKKSRSIRVNTVQDSIERINSGWSMQETSEILSQVLSANAYDELAASFSVINYI